MPGSFKRAALVTGAGKRLGRAIAIALGRDGFNVGVHYRGSKAEAEEVVDLVKADGGEAAAIQANLSQEQDVAGLISKTVSEIGPLSLLVNSASSFEDDGVGSMTRESYDLHMETNLRAPLKLAQDFAQQDFLKQTSGNDNAPGVDALVVNLIDQRVLKLTPQFLSYTLSKAALFTVTKTLAQALGPQGIRVNGIGPGPTIRNARQSEADFAEQCAATVLGRGAKPDDIVSALRFLIASPAVTGQMIAVDGGQHLTWQTPDVLVAE